MSEIERLKTVMARLRDPEGGCPWDREQTFDSVAPYTIEEAYEVADAIERGDLQALREELGDLLLQVIFHSRIAEEQGAFDFDAVAQGVAEKMVERHPHVFGADEERSQEVHSRRWEDQKAGERERKARESGRSPSLLDDVPQALPALMRAEKLSKRAARVGFEWPTVEEVLEKLHEELEELAQARAGGHLEEVEEELGDLLYTVANLARKLQVDPEVALRRTNRKFERRFRFVEQQLLRRGRRPEASTLEEMDALWEEAKLEERHSPDADAPARSDAAQAGPR